MTKKIIWTRPDGGCSVFTPAPEFLARFENATEAMEAAAARAVPADASDVMLVDEADMPTDREFRDAWRQAGDVVTIDLPTARTIQKARVQRAKRAKARELNERETAGEDVTGEKAILRAVSVDQDIDRASDLDGLKATWPTALARR